MPPKLRPNRDIATALLSKWRAADRTRRQQRQEAVLREWREQCRRSGVAYTERVEIFGVLGAGAGDRIRRDISRSWGASRVRLVINSPGGLSVIARGILDDLRELKSAGVQLEARVLHHCCSAAIPI